MITLIAFDCTVQHRFLKFIREIGCVRMLKNRLNKVVQRLIGIGVDGLDSWSRCQIIDIV